MQQIHNNLNLPTGTYEQPAGIVEATVCSKSGLLPVEGLCDNDPMGNCIITEYFTEDTVPTEYCTTHTKVTICNDSGDIATIWLSKHNNQDYEKESCQHPAVR